MLSERLIGTIEGLGKYPQLRTERGRTWFLKPAPGITGDQFAALDLRVGETVELIGIEPRSLAGECRLFSVWGRKLQDGSRIDLMNESSAT